MNQVFRQRPLLAWLAVLLFTIAWFYTLDLRTLVPTDEGRYAEMGREMALSGDWITTRLNGIKYFEKPPLQTWMNALTFKLFGLGEWQARLWTGLCGFLTIFLTAFTGKKLFNADTGLFAGIILGSCLFWNGLGHINTLDMGLSAMMSLSLCALLVAQRDGASRNENRLWMHICWLGMALAVLSKGLIGLVLPGAVLVLYSVIARDWKIWRRLHIVTGLLVFFAVTTPWFILVSIKNPEFPRFFFIHEHFERFLTKTHNRAGPMYYFVPLLLVGILPWLGVMLQSIVNGFRMGPKAGFSPGKLLAIWALFIFIFFSISGSKLPSYILPIFPALALLIASFLVTANLRQHYVNAGLVLGIGVIGLVLSPKFSSLSKIPQETPIYQSYQNSLLLAALIALIGAIGALLLLKKRHKIISVLCLGVAGFVAGQILLIGHEAFGRYASAYTLVPAINAELRPDTPIYMVGMYNQTLPFYLRRTVTLVEHPDEFEFGLEQQPELWIPKRKDFIKVWTSGPKAIAITNPDRYQELKKSGIPMRIIAEDPRRVVVTNDLGDPKSN